MGWCMRRRLGQAANLFLQWVAQALPSALGKGKSGSGVLEHKRDARRASIT